MIIVAILIVMVSLVWISLILNTIPFETKCNGNCNQGRNCDCDGSHHAKDVE